MAKNAHSVNAKLHSGEDMGTYPSHWDDLAVLSRATGLVVHLCSTGLKVPLQDLATAIAARAGADAVDLFAPAD